MKKYFNNATLTPNKVLAGDSLTLIITLEAGEMLKGENSRIIVDFPTFLGASRPTVEDQENDGYVAVFCSNPDVSYRKRTWDIEITDFPTPEHTSFRGMAQRFFVIDNIVGDISEGDTFEIHYGYTRDNFSVGAKMPIVVLRKDLANTIDVRYFEDANLGLPDLCRNFKGYARPVPDYEVSLAYTVLPRETERLRIINNQAKTLVIAQDRFANPSENPQKYVDVKGNLNHFDVLELPKNQDVNLIGIKANNAPIMTDVYDGMNVYFGDFHCHSYLSNDCIEREKMPITPEMMYDYGKNVSGLDFMSISDHHQPWDIERNKIGAKGWSEILSASEKSNKDGEFVAFAGFEFRGVRGDTAVVLNDKFDYDFIDNPKMTSIQKLWDLFNGKDYITIPHLHNPGALSNGDWFYCPYKGVETLLEVYSCHGSYEAETVVERMTPSIKGRRPDRNVKSLLGMGNKYGLCCNSDGHKGNPGRNGLTAIFAKELTKDAIFDAIRNRRVYGTTNARIKLAYTVNGAFMGSDIEKKSSNEFYINAEGENIIKSIDIIGDGVLIKRFKPNSLSFCEKVTIEANCNHFYVKVVQIDNHIAYGSPVFCS